MRPLWVCLEMRSLSKPLGKRWSAMTGFWSSKCSYCLYIHSHGHLGAPSVCQLGGLGVSCRSFGLYAWSSRSLKWHRPEIGARFTAVSILLVRLNSVNVDWTMLNPSSLALMWVKQCRWNHPFGNGKHTTYKKGDDWGDGLLLLYHVIPTLLIMSFPPWSKILAPTTGRGSLAASMDRFYCIHDTFKVVPPNDGYGEITNIFHWGGMPMANTSMPNANVQ